jgi:hypothetical protein
MRPSHLAILTLPLMLLLSACQDRQPAAQPQEQAPPAEAAGPEAADPAAPAQALRDEAGLLREPELPARDTSPVDARIEATTLSNQGDPETGSIGPATTVFGPQDTVYVQVHTKGSAPEYTLYAKWLSPDGEVLSDYGMRVAQGVDSRTVISLSKPDGLLPGENRIEIAINGQPPRVLTYQVR